VRGGRGDPDGVSIVRGELEGELGFVVPGLDVVLHREEGGGRGQGEGRREGRREKAG
jgi:hypothetical protein